jgi:hypothetical protein
MAELSAYAIQILEHLKKDREFRRHYDAEPLFHQWDNYVNRVSFFNRYPDMTDHGPSHANSVVGLVAQLALPPRDGQEKSPLNASELFCLTGAAWLHDIGMYTTGELDVFDPESIRKRHCCLSRDKMREERDILFPGLPKGDVDIISSIAAYHQSRTALDDDHRATLEGKAAEKGVKLELVEGMPTLAEELRQLGWPESIASLEWLLGPEGRAGGPATFRQPIRVKLLAALVRLLDQCDIQMIRAGNLDFLMRRVDRSNQLRSFYESLVKAIGPTPPEEDGRKLLARLSKEVGYFSETHDYYLRDFWVERTFITAVPGPAGGGKEPRSVAATRRIYIKMNDEAGIRAQLGLIPTSLEATKKRVLDATKTLDHYLDHATHYVRKELDLLQEPYLTPAGLRFEVHPYPGDPKERHGLQRAIRSRSPYREEFPKPPEVFEREDHPVRLAERLGSGKDGRVLVVYGPRGRGRRQLVRSLAEAYLQKRGHGELSKIFWHVVEEGSQVQDAVHDAGAYFASLGEYALFNVVHEEGLVGDKHVRFCLDLLARSDAPQVVVLEGLNKVDTRSRAFLRGLFRALEGKLVVAVTTRWPSAEASQAYFEDLDGEVRFLECPRLSKATGRKVLARLAGGAKVRADASAAWVDGWAERWEAWGREGFFLRVLAENLWIAGTKADLLPSVVEAAVRAEVAEGWSRLGDRRTQRTALEAFASGSAAAGGARVAVGATPDPALQDLVDRGLARWERRPEQSPWLEDDPGDVLTGRAPGAGAAWLHPAFGHCFGTSA